MLFPKPSYVTRMIMVYWPWRLGWSALFKLGPKSQECPGNLGLVNRERPKLIQVVIKNIYGFSGYVIY